MTIVPVFLRKKHQNLFPGEIAGFDEEKAGRLIKDKIAFAIDDDRNPIVTEDEDSEGIDVPDSPQPIIDATHKFVLDGLTEHVAELLAGAGLTTPEQVRVHVQAGKKLNDIKGIGAKTAGEIEELYGEADDFGDDDSQSDFLDDEEDDEEDD